MPTELEGNGILELCDRAIIEKTRHVVECNGDICERGVFEVTNDSRFFNAALVDEPYAQWSEQRV